MIFFNFVSDNDLIFCKETWQKSNSNFEIKGYKCISVPKPERGKRGHGGICLFVRNSILSGVEVVDENSAGFLWVKLCKTVFDFENDMFIRFCYIPP